MINKTIEQQLMDAQDEIIELKEKLLVSKSETAFLRGKVDAYEHFLERNGFINGGEE